ncbi:MAG: hypothetical protein RL199_2099 [Pseudomonadota bacterium]
MRTIEDLTPPVPRPQRAPLPFRVGLVPGLVAAVTMFSMLAIVAVASGASPWQPMRVVALPFLGHGALDGGPGPTVLGLAVHLVVGTLLGGVFTRVVGRMRRRRQLGVGLFYALSLWLVAQYVVLPMLVPPEAVQMGTLWSFFMGHLGYGLMLGASVPSFDDIDAPAGPDEGITA